MAAGKLKITRTFTKDRETKNTVRYAEDGDVVAVGTLYVQKSELEGKTPEQFQLTIQEV